ncbi:MAG: hypothetical protein J3Q66DRAFT_362785 [Benniella sp.]|nr:MAG: hypothetical protein J3Q66DRAFT_362785 [Benniella sp.]
MLPRACDGGQCLGPAFSLLLPDLPCHATCLEIVDSTSLPGVGDDDGFLLFFGNHPTSFEPDPNLVAQVLKDCQNVRSVREEKIGSLLHFANNPYLVASGRQLGLLWCKEPLYRCERRRPPLSRY